MSKTREQIITSMCYTWRHDYSLERREHDGPGGLISSGLTKTERELLWKQMAQLFDNNIAPNMEFKARACTSTDSLTTSRHTNHLGKKTSL